MSNVLLNRRRDIMQAALPDFPYNLHGYGALYPESEFRPHSNVNIIEYIMNQDSHFGGNYSFGWSFSDGGEASIGYISGYLPFNFTAIYILNGYVQTSYIDINSRVEYSFPEGATQRIILGNNASTSGYTYSFYGFNVSGANCFVSNISLKGYYPYGVNTGISQILISPQCEYLNIVETLCIEMPSSAGGLVDTCHLVFDSSTRLRWSSYSSKPLPSRVIWRKVSGNIPTNFSPFPYNTGIKDFVFEFTQASEIQQYDANIGIPNSATLHVPLGTTQLYVDKGWNFANIAEYTPDGNGHADRHQIQWS